MSLRQHRTAYRGVSSAQSLELRLGLLRPDWLGYSRSLFFSSLVCLGLFGCQQATPPISQTPGIQSPKPSGSGSPVTSVTAKKAECPVKLTASDGTGLELVKYEAKAVVNGPLAFTELHLTFKNPQERQIEGHFEITMPEKAALSRFAMKVGGNWQEAEVVELQQARAAYEDFLHRRQDPALLEKQAGNQFQARVFPIPASGEKELILSYSQELAGQEDYRLPLAGLPKVSTLSVRASVWQGPKEGNKETKLDLQSEAPAEDFVVKRELLSGGLVKDNLVLLQVSPKINDSAIQLSDTLVLVDTSASRAAGYQNQMSKLQELMGELVRQGKGQLKLAAFDQEVTELYSGPFDQTNFRREDGARGRTANSGGPSLDTALELLSKRRPLGATNLQSALKWASQQKGFTRVIVITDGVDTAGQDELKIEGKDFQRVDAILFGGIRKAESLASLVTHLPQCGLVLDGEKSAKELSNSLLRNAMSGVKVEVKGAQWVWPNNLDSLEPGQQRIVYAQMESPTQKVEVKLSGSKGFAEQNLTVDLTSVAWPLLQRAATAAHIQRMLEQRKTAKDKEKAELTADILQLSTKNRVVCDLTALLVLETDGDYARFGIQRTALADILCIGQNGIETVHRTAPPVAKQPKQVVDFRSEPSLPGDTQSKGAPSSVVVSDDIDAGAEFSALTSNEGRRGVSTTAAQRKTESFSRETAGGEAPPPAPSSGLPASAAQPPSDLRFRESSGGRVGQAGRRPNYNSPFGSNSGASIQRDESNAGRRTSHPEYYNTSGLVEREVARPEPVAATPASTAASSRNIPTGLLSNGSSSAPDPGWQGTGSGAPALTGEFQEIQSLLGQKKTKDALNKAQVWQEKQPGDLLALIALGECYHAMDQDLEAARAYGSIIDLFPGRADLRRYAGCRLEELGKQGQSLALDTFTKALDQRPDHPSSYRLKAYSLVKEERYREAFETLEKGLKTSYPGGRFAQVYQVLSDDIGIVGQLWISHDSKVEKEVKSRLASCGGRLSDTPTTRFVLIWETDANDVDFHIRDGNNSHAFYSYPQLNSGGRLYADVTTGFGPECFNIPGGAKSGPYKIGVHYYARGPMGFGMGKVEVLRHDGKGKAVFEEKPYVVMNDGAFVDLGQIQND